MTSLQPPLVPLLACQPGCGDACCAPAIPANARPADVRLAWLLTALTIGWNSIEAIIAIGSGVAADSAALIGFGLDSIVEVSSALIIVWRLARHSRDAVRDQRTEQLAVRAIAVSFFVLAAFVGGKSLLALAGLSPEPETSAVGLLLVALSLLVMPLLAWSKRRVARRMGSFALAADAQNTQLCTYLSAVVLVGLGAHAVFGWWWFDPLAGLIIAGLAVWEGQKAWRSGELCC